MESEGDITVEIQKLNVLADLYQSTAGSAGYDIVNVEDVTVPKNTTVVVRTGLVLKMPENMCALVLARSSTYLNDVSIFPAIIDSDYRLELKYIAFNRKSTDIVLRKNKRYAQLLFFPKLNISIEENDNLYNEDEPHTGFGSTG